MTTRLEDLHHYPLQLLTREARVIVRDEAITAARLDAEDAYRRGVEDERARALLEEYNHVEIARYYIRRRDETGYQSNRSRHELVALSRMDEAKELFDKAFHGARGIARVEIRQRLERLKEGNGNEQR